MTHTQSKNKEMKRCFRMLAILLVPVVALILGAAAPELWAGNHDDDDDDELEFEETWFNIEFNFSDKDLGVRGFVDGEPWKEVEIENPKGRTIAEVEAEKSMAKQGFAELFFESGEPPLDEVSIKQFLRRFPVGTYEFEGETIEGDEIEGEAEFTHVIPCGPVISADVVNGNIIISWNEVNTVVDLDSTSSNVSCEDSYDLEIVGYRVEVEWEDDDEVSHTFGIDIRADQDRRVTVPPEFIPPGQDYDFEVLAIEASGNQTITEAEDMAP